MEVAAGVHSINLLSVPAAISVNVFAIPEAEVTLVDAGIAGSLGRIERGLAELGRALVDVRRVVVTHGHPDHAGTAAELEARRGDDRLRPLPALVGRRERGPRGARPAGPAPEPG